MSDKTLTVVTNCGGVVLQGQRQKASLRLLGGREKREWLPGGERLSELEKSHRSLKKKGVKISTI